MVTCRVTARSRARRARAHAASRCAGAPAETGNAMTRVSSATRSGGRPPASARHRYPVLRPMPICRHASTVGIPSMISFQYSSSNTSRRLRPPSSHLHTPSHSRGVARRLRTRPSTRGQFSDVADTTNGRNGSTLATVLVTRCSTTASWRVPVELQICRPRPWVHHGTPLNSPPKPGCVKITSPQCSSGLRPD